MLKGMVKFCENNEKKNDLVNMTKRQGNSLFKKEIVA